MKHTPGPWSSDGYNLTTVIAEYHDKPNNYQHICDCDFGTDDPKKYLDINYANAEFIVRACNNHYELLEACKKAKWLYDELALSPIAAATKYGDNYEPLTDTQCLEINLQLRQAISKAEGEK